MRSFFLIATLFFIQITTAQPSADTTFDTSVQAPAYTGTAHPKILFDEAHHNFHTAGGRYKPFADVLRNDGYLVVSNKSKITRETLKGSDVFVCANAFASAPDSITGRLPLTAAFTSEECLILKEWVSAGGSILLVADHEPAGNAVADLSDSFKVNMSKTYTGDPLHFNKVVLDASWIEYSFSAGNLANHPITKGRNSTEKIKKVLSFTGHSLKGPRECVPILLLSPQAYDIVNIENPAEATTKSAKGRCQGLAMPFGKGRVVIWGEAAMLTAQDKNFGMNYPGIDNKQLVLNIMHWLSRLI